MISYWIIPKLCYLFLFLMNKLHDDPTYLMISIRQGAKIFYNFYI